MKFIILMMTHKAEEGFASTRERRQIDSKWNQTEEENRQNAFRTAHILTHSWTWAHSLFEGHPSALMHSTASKPSWRSHFQLKVQSFLWRWPWMFFCVSYSGLCRGNIFIIYRFQKRFWWKLLVWFSAFLTPRSEPSWFKRWVTMVTTGKVGWEGKWMRNPGTGPPS